MKKLIYYVIAIGFSLQSCSQDEISLDLNPTTFNLSPQAPEVIKSNNSFGLALFGKVSEGTDDNLMLSPLSASAVLTMLLNGCEGETYNQLKNTLAYPEGMDIQNINETYMMLVKQLLEADPQVKMSLANAVFYREQFNVKQSYKDILTQDFKANVQALDFNEPAALNTINQWASDNTNGKIPKVLEGISSDAVMFLMNALYFKGDWTYQFDKNKTAPSTFFLEDGNQIQVDMMKGAIGSKRTHHNGSAIIEMPYGRTNFSMVVMIPNDSTNEFVSNLDESAWNEITTSLDEQNEWSEFDVLMPKFKFSNEKYLNGQLQSMGMIDAFSPFDADLSGIADANIYVSFVKQNTFVEVNEEGTEAAAVTTVGISLTSGLPPSFNVNRPFVFAIRERTTNTLIFIGKVMNPLKN
ncbi:serpin family protein [Marivirga sp.]|uniref:serpin family protein n=1 Tax=Marivirga sp. TaxID=2018662 RepID=UPI0025E9DA85|nr:serpin family protein [Marivirga sp.]